MVPRHWYQATFKKCCLVPMALLACACAPNPDTMDADVIVVGGGIAGLSAALEAAEAGARVLVVEKSSVAGGHAVSAGGFALVGTPVQEKKGITDTPDIAYADIMAWAEDADPYWVRRFAEESRKQVYDWLTGFGVRFAFVIDTPEDSVPRFHFTAGAAVNAVLPLIRASLKHERIGIMPHAEAVELTQAGGRIGGAVVRDTRSRETRTLRAPAIVLATGGFQSNLDLVRRTWREDVAAPATLLIGSGQNATGSGITLGESAGAGLHRMDRHVTFINGLPNPRAPGRGLLVQSPRAIWVNRNAERFVDEGADSKAVTAAIMAQPGQTHWLVFDAEGRRRLIVRGAAWLNRKTLRREILDNETLVSTADSIEGLAKAAGLPGPRLQQTVAAFNTGEVTSNTPQRVRDRSSNAALGGGRFTLSSPPYYAMQLYPMTRKSMGGLAIDKNAAVVDADGAPIPGLFAAGELTGVAGINGSHGGSGTFLGPSVLLGRLAGRSAAALSLREQPDGDMADRKPPPAPDMSLRAGPGPDVAEATDTAAVTMSADALRALVDTRRAGYWHFEAAHGIVLERAMECQGCHSADWPAAPATTRARRLAQLESCTNGH